MNIYDLFMTPFEKRLLSKVRQDIISKAFGNVLEIGYGTGVNFKYYNQSIITNLTALDLESSKVAINRVSCPVNFVIGSAENIPFENNTFDTIVETLVFCSVNDLNKSITEVIRVLKPGGIFIFIDHVLPKQKKFATLFNVWNLIWPKIANGCNLNRESHKAIESAGFTIEQSGSSNNTVFRWGVGRKK